MIISCRTNLLHGQRRGFTLLLMFLVLLLVLFAGVFSQVIEIHSLGRLQVSIIKQDGEIRPKVDPRIKSIIPAESLR